jgi:uncharacterized protein (TIGR03437 family)
VGNKATVIALVLALVLAAIGLAQPVPTQAPPNWNHIGNSAIQLGLVDVATGPVARVWYSADGAVLRILTLSGKTFETNDFETWLSSSLDTPVPPVPVTQATNSPEGGAQFRVGSGPSRLYAFGTFVYRSDDAGAHWFNLTLSHARSLIGGPLLDLAVSPGNPDEIVVAGANGVFRTVDGGLSWSGLNEGLPNLPPARILALPSGSHGLQADLGDAVAAEWQPGERQAWRPNDNPQARQDHDLRGALSSLWGVTVTAVALSGDYIYAGNSEGDIRVSQDQGRTWQDFLVTAGGPVTAFWVNPLDPRTALATLGSSPHAPEIVPAHVIGTISAGRSWESVSGGLADAAVSGITADLPGNAVYAATARGVFLGRINLTTMSSASWIPITGLPPGSAADVKLDAGANKLWVALEGLGVYEGLPPHRIGDPHVVSSADYSTHVAAPGTLLSVPGARVRSATAGGQNVPVLDANDTESQIQVPFNVTGSTLTLTLLTGDGIQFSSSLPMGLAAPAICVNQDGSPILLDADNVMIDAARPTHPRDRIHILATGLGAVQPELLAGTPAPLSNPPQVLTAVNAWLDGQPVQVIGKAVLAPSLIGFYLVEIEIPTIVNYGPGELYIEANGQQSNHVRVDIDP